MPSSTLRLEQLQFSSDGCTPNSPHPVLVYRDVPIAESDIAAAFERLFDSHFWPARWRAQVYDYHHYHSTSHEVLGVSRGWARLMLGGERGQAVEVKAGDALVLPAGTGHCQLEASADFEVVGGYPTGQDYDLLRPQEATHDQAAARIAQVATPASDPVSGTEGALVSLWRPGPGPI